MSDKEHVIYLGKEFYTVDRLISDLQKLKKDGVIHGNQKIAFADTEYQEIDAKTLRISSERILIDDIDTN